MQVGSGVNDSARRAGDDLEASPLALPNSLVHICAGRMRVERQSGRNMKTILCGAVTSALLAASLPAQAEPAQLPADVKALIPETTEILDSASADLTGDDLADYVVVAERTNSADPEDPTRTVFVIQQKPAGTFAVAAQNDRAVITKMNGGLSGSFDSISAQKKGFTISHSGGRREKWTANYIFGFSRIDNAWQLIRVEGSRWSEKGEVRTFKPPHDFGKIAFEEFDTEKWQGVGEGYRKSKLTKPLIAQ